MNHPAASVIMEQQQRLHVRDTLHALIHQIVRVAVGQNQVREAVVVVIQKSEAPSAQQARGAGDSMTPAEIRKSLVAIVAVDRERLLVDIGHEKILAAV